METVSRAAVVDPDVQVRMQAAGTGPERVPVTVYETSVAASRAVAQMIAELIRARAAAGERAVLGLATGSTPQGVYDELVRLHREEQLSFRNVVTFNLDEYWPIEPDALQSYRRFMQESLFDHVDIPQEATHVPDGQIARQDIERYCNEYERAIRQAGGIDLQLLGVGRTGHIGFNEPGSSADSRTRLITLDRVTRLDAASDFFGERNVPRQAITMGVGTILGAKRVVLLAFGEHKAAIIKRAVEGDVSAAVAASYLQKHADAHAILDPAASAELTRISTPWLLASLATFGMQWDTRMTRRATIWLARRLDCPILKLTDEDYNEHGLQELLAARGGSHGGAYDINIEVFRSLQDTITGWPGGKPNVPGEVFPKRVVVFSPHPDDDVISMGGTFMRLCAQGHEVHVAYQTSGSIAVWDEAAVRHLDFVRELAREFPEFGGDAADRLADRITAFVATKKAGQVDIPELRKVKALIRRTEARAAARLAGAQPPHIHFLDLPFYDTGRVRKRPISEEDVSRTAALLDAVRPHQIYAAGDLSDPHGTHRVCLAIVTHAMRNLKERDWMRACTVWLYRGAWQEWDPAEIEMAVPLSPDEVVRKRVAIFKHESQKDYAMFPGPSDRREFWERAEARNRETARLYDALGLAEYEAIEGFVRARAEGLGRD